MKHKFIEPDGGIGAIPLSNTTAGVSQTSADRNAEILRHYSAGPTAYQPTYIRLPRSGTLCPYSGLSRTQMWGFVKDGLVVSHSLRRRGACRGVRLIDFASLLKAIAGFASAEETEGVK